MEAIQLLQITPEQLTTLFDKVVETRLNDLKENFQPKTPTEYVTRNEVAKMFSIDVSSVHNWTKSGRLKAYSIGGRIYYLRSEIEASLTPLNP